MKTVYPSLSVNELKLGDRVRMDMDHGEGEGYTTFTVICITEEEITFFRPYTQTSDVVYSDGLIAYIGVEKYKVPLKHTSMKYVLLYREKVPPR